MNADIFQERWAQVRSEAQRRWNKLTDEDLDAATGKADKLIDVIEDRYGWSRKKAKAQVDELIKQYGNGMQDAAQSLLADANDLVSDNPWVAIIGGLLVVGLIVSLLVRPRMSRCQ
jgi:uncharacterized protein YjbJ (UPF0337 family)